MRRTLPAMAPVDELPDVDETPTRLDEGPFDPGP